MLYREALRALKHEGATHARRNTAQETLVFRPGPHGREFRLLQEHGPLTWVTVGCWQRDPTSRQAFPRGTLPIDEFVGGWDGPKALGGR